MSYVSSVVDDVRYDLNDTDSTRFSDAVVLAVLKKAVRRCNRIAQRNGLNFAKKSATLTTVANQAYVALPADFDTVLGKPCLFRDGTHVSITQRTEAEWETILSATGLANFLIDQTNDRILFNGTPTGVETLTFWYYPTISTSTWTTSNMSSSTMPWGGRVDDIVAEYTSLRLKNLSEMDASFDLSLMTDMESQILLSYSTLAPTIVDGKGWLD